MRQLCVRGLFPRARLQTKFVCWVLLLLVAFAFAGAPAWGSDSSSETLEKQMEKAATELTQKIEEQLATKLEGAKEIAGDQVQQAFDFVKGLPILLVIAAFLIGLFVFKAVSGFIKVALAIAVVAAVVWYLSTMW